MNTIEKIEVEEHAPPAECCEAPHPEEGPDDGPSPRATMTASEALGRLRQGETLHDVRINRLRLGGDFARPVRLRRVVLSQPSFEGANFQDEVAIEGCTLLRPRIIGASFARGLVLTGSSLVGPSLRDATFSGPFRGDYMRVRGALQAIGCRFEEPVRLWDAHFEGWVKLESCTFEGEADFRSFHADEGFLMTGCRFARDALFRGATVCKKWDAADSRFEALLDLSRAKLHDFAYLEAIEQGPEQRFAFHNALAERLLVRPEQVEGRLDSERRGDFARAREEYGLLKRTFEGLHRDDQEDWAFYRFKVNGRRACPRSWRRPWTKLGQFLDWLLLDIGCGYGTHPLRAVSAAGLLMLAFGLVYVAGAEALNVESLPFPERGIAYLPNRLLVGLLTSVSVFTSGFESLRDAAQGWMNLPLVLESLLGTLLWGLFIVAFSRKVIR
jgi:hypothetical protein